MSRFSRIINVLPLNIQFLVQVQRTNKVPIPAAFCGTFATTFSVLSSQVLRNSSNDTDPSSSTFVRRRYSSSSSTSSAGCFAAENNLFQILRRQQYTILGLQRIPTKGQISSHAHSTVSIIAFGSYRNCNKCKNPALNAKYQPYHTSTTMYHLVHKDAEVAEPTEEELAETEDTIPVWQNPLHHNNPEMQKMFKDDFDDGEEIPIIPLPPLETDPDKVVAPPHIHELAHQIVHLNLLELKELTDKIADHFGFDDDMMAARYGGGGAMSGGGDGNGIETETKEEKTIFDLKLVGFDAKAKIKVIKEVRSIGGLGLKEAKELVEGAPKVIQRDLKQDKADELKAKLEAVGAQVEIV